MLRAALGALRTRAVARAPSAAAPRRGMAGASGGASFHGFHPPAVDPTFKALGDGMMTVMWLWIFYRSYHDGATVLVSRVMRRPVCDDLVVAAHVGSRTAPWSR